MKNRRQVVLGDRYWNSLREMSVIEQRSISEILREAITDLFEKRKQNVLTGYDPITDTLNRDHQQP